jgi:hypothetical protein
VPKLSRQFVLFFGTLLSFVNDTQLFAGFISLPPMVDRTPPALFQTSEGVCPREEGPSAAMTSPSAETSEAISARNQSVSLLCGLCQETAQEQQPTCDGAGSNSLPGNDNSNPTAPRPSIPPGGCEAGTTGVAPSNGPKDHQSGQVTLSTFPIPEADKYVSSYRVGSIRDRPSGVFRPPRAA